jgi:uncharacterized protein (TIGR02246 family)
MMTRIFVWASAATALGVSAAVIAAPPGKTDIGEMQRLADSNDAAWNLGDATAISGNYAAEGSLRLSDAAEVFQGREAVRSYFAKSFAGRPAGFRHVTRLDHIDMITPDVAFTDAHVRVEKSNPDGSWSTVREYRNNSVAVRQGKKWQLRTVRAYALPSKPSS